MRKLLIFIQSKEKSYKASVVLAYITLGVNCFSGIFFTPYMIHILGESDYGLYQLIGAFAGYLSILNMGMSSAVTKYVSKYYRQKNFQHQGNFLGFVLLYYSFISVIILIVGYGMYGKIGAIFALSSDELLRAERMFVLLVVNLMFTLFGGIFIGVLSAYENFLWTKGLDLLKVLVRLFTIYAILERGSGSVGIVVVDTVLNFTLLVIYAAYCVMGLKIRFYFGRIEIKELKEIIFYSFFVFLNIIFDQLNWKIDHTILGMKLSTAAVTVYSIGMNFSNYFMNFSIAVKSFFLPRVMYMEVDGKGADQYTLFMARTGRLQGYLLFYLYFAFVFLGRQFIQIIMKTDYYEAWISAVFVMSGLLVPLLQNAGHPILQAKNKHHIYVLVCLFISGINAVSTWFVVDYWGIIGAAFMTMLSFAVGQGIFLSWYYDKKMGMNMKKFFYEIWIGNVRPLLGLIPLCAFICCRHYATTWGEFMAQGILYSMAYFVSIYMWGMYDEEKKIIFGFVSKFRRKSDE